MPGELDHADRPWIYELYVGIYYSQPIPRAGAQPSAEGRPDVDSKLLVRVVG